MSESDRHEDRQDPVVRGPERNRDAFASPARGIDERASDHRRADDHRSEDRYFGPRFDDRRFGDEVSLRDLYLILVRGLPTILVVAVLAGLGAFLVSTARPASYEAEATVTSRPPSVRFGADPTVVLGADESAASTLLPMQPLQGITVEAYQAISQSRAVFELARSTLGDGAPELAEFRGAAVVDAASESESSLLVRHRVTWNDPETASLYANAWADATVERVREKLVTDLEPMIRITDAAVSQRREALEAVEAELMALPAGDDSEAASRERSRLQREVAAARRAYVTVADLEPTLVYLAELVPSGTQILEPATPPMDSSGPSTTLVTALASLLGAMVAMLGVFLREAIREPDAAKATRPSPSSRSDSRTSA